MEILPGAVDREGIRQIVLAEDDDPQPVAAGEQIGRVELGAQHVGAVSRPACRRPSRPGGEQDDGD